MLVLRYICETSVAKELSADMRLEIKVQTELKSLSGSGLACKSVTTVMICCLQALKVLRASLKVLAALRGVSTVLSPSTRALGSDGEKSLESDEEKVRDCQCTLLHRSRGDFLRKN